MAQPIRQYQSHSYPPLCAGWLFDRLVGHVGPGRVFKDVDSIGLGEDFVEKITAAVRSSAVLLAVIGVRWLEARDENGQRRLDDPQDFVRVEIETALECQVQVIPVLVDGAQMPAAAELPPSLRQLARLQASHLSSDRFGMDTRQLLEVLARGFAGASAGEREPSGWLLSLDRFIARRLAPVNWLLVLTGLAAVLTAAFGTLAYFTTTTDMTAKVIIVVTTLLSVFGLLCALLSGYGLVRMTRNKRRNAA